MIDETALTLARQNMLERGIPSALIGGDFSAEAGWTEIKANLAAMMQYAVRTGQLLARIGMELGGPQPLIEEAELRGVTRAAVVFCVLQAESFAGLKFLGDDDEDTRRRSKRVNGAQDVALLTGQQAEMALTGESSPAPFEQMLKERTGFKQRESQLRNRVAAAEYQQKRAEEESERLRGELDRVLDPATGTPRWIPANADERRLAASVEQLKSRADLLSVELRAKLRSAPPIDPALAGLIRGTIGYVEARIGAAAAEVLASIGLGELQGALELDRMAEEQWSTRVQPGLTIGNSPEAARKPQPEAGLPAAEETKAKRGRGDARVVDFNPEPYER